MRLKITDAGFAKLVNPPNTGTNAVLITQIGLTPTAFVPSAGLTALPGEIKRVASFGGQAVGDDTVHVTIRDDSATAYTLRGFGLYLADGTLFATYGQADPIMEKSAASMLLLATDTRFAEVDTALIQFGDAGFLYPPATTEVVGVVELATATEAEDATDTQRAVTPRGVRAYTDKRFGASAPTALAKTLLSAASTTAARTALELKSAALKDIGHGNGLDADTLDGKHASEFALAGDFATVGHKHVIADVTGLQEAINDKANLSRNDFRDQQFIGGTYPLLGFGKYGAETAYIGAWEGRSVWRSWNAGRTAAGELTIAHNDVPRWNGSAMWHAGNFAPDTKMDKTGGTFTGHVGVNGNSLRSYGWNGVANDGVLVLGDTNSYIFKNGSNFTFANAAGGYTAMLNAGGTVWTSGNFDPSKKLSTTGGDLTGPLRMRGNAAGRIALYDDNLDVANIEIGAGLNTGADRNGFLVNRNANGSLALLGGNGKAKVTVDGGVGYTVLSSPPLGTGLWNSQTALHCVIPHGGNADGMKATLLRSVNGANGWSSARWRLYREVDATTQGYIDFHGDNTDGDRVFTFAGYGQSFWLSKTGVVEAPAGFNRPSSRKLKSDHPLTPLSYGLAEIEKIETYFGQYNSDFVNDERRRLFMIAEQLSEIVPEAVFENAVDYRGEKVPSIQESQLIPVLVRAIQELAEEIRSLKGGY
ncbi:tail fiber domain-containing protein [Stenotrophomonas maltophilia]|nr:tail fiber domain-containing protein [Stenotrophomonas maltophilia]MBH1600470.1 tail fiber domain-containing protein [Stenotrophomonas maltophilia]